MRFCILKNSDKLRAAVGLRLKQLGLTPFRVAAITGLRLTGINSYLKGKNTNLTQGQIIQLCDFLGIVVNLKIEFLE